MEVINDVNERNLSKRAIDAITEDVIKVVKSTNKIIDASNGRECQDHHQKAVQELAQLKTSISEDRNISEIWISEFEVLLEICPFLISQSQQERMQSIIQSLKNALANNDLSAMQAYSEKAERESDGLPELVRLVQMCRFAIQRAYAGASSDANIMADKFGRLLHALKNESVEADRLWRDLQPMIKQWIDCELPSASISTGLVNT